MSHAMPDVTAASGGPTLLPFALQDIEAATEPAREAVASYEHMLRQLQSFVAGMILMRSVDGVDDAIDDVLESPRYHELQQSCARAMPWETMLRAAHSSAPPQPLLRRLSSAATDNVRRATEIDTALVRALLRMAATNSAPPPHDLKPMWFMTASLPPVVKEGLLGRVVSDVASVGTVALAENASSELLDALSDRWLEGRRKFLGVLASSGMVDVGRDLLPDTYRFDPEAVKAEYWRGIANSEALAAKVKASGKGLPAHVERD